MHDIKFIREHPEAFDAALARRGVAAQAQVILELDEARRSYETMQQVAQAKRNSLSKLIGQAFAAGNKALAEQLKEEASLDKSLEDSTGQLTNQKAAELKAELAAHPNVPDVDVPDGADEAGNVEVAKWGTARQFNFAPKEHADLGPALGLDFETGAAISGSRFTFLRGQMARLQRALGQFMLDQQTLTNGYSECAPPLLVWDKALFGTGQLPKFEEDLYGVSTEFSKLSEHLKERQQLQAALSETSEFNAVQNDSLAAFTERQISMGRDMSELVEIFERNAQYFTQNAKKFENFENQFLSMKARFEEFDSRGDGHRHYLIPTAEVSLTNSVREQILSESQLPIRMTALTPCFRSEAGAAGKDTRGYIRQHQFEKVELVSICRPEDSAAEHERMTLAAESILQALELPYRKMLLCAGDMGFTARKTYDLEVWLPGQNAYREISSCSNCGDFQARRMNTRYRPEGAKGTEFVHTLNGSGLAVGRTLVAVLENYQQEDGSVTVPDALLPYMGGITALVPN